MKRLKIVILVSSIALLSLVAIQYITIKTNLNYNKDLETMSVHSQKINQVYLVLNLLLNIESGGRGYLLTGVTKYLWPYEYAMERLPIELLKLYPLLDKRDADNLASLIKKRVDHATKVIEKKKNNQHIPPSDLEIGKGYMDRIRSLITVILDKENKSVAIMSTTKQSGETIAVELIGGSLFSFMLVGLSVFYVLSEFKKRIDTQKELRISLATSEAISRDIDFGVIASDTDGNVIFSNKWIANKFPGLKRLEDFFATNPLVHLPLKQLLAGQIDTITEIELKIQNQNKIFTVTSSPYQINDVQQGAVITIIDTTDSTQKMASLVTSKQMADLASKAKSDFLAKMSHEIRTPLNAILGVGEILSLSDLDKEQERCLEIFKRSAITLNNLVNDILDLSKIEAGKIDIINAPFSVNNLINSCSSIMDFRASQKGLLFTVDMDNKLDHFIGDEGRIRQILLNLLSNAIKFTELGEVKFSFSSVSDGKKAELVFSVKDSGKGISSENLDKLFTNYQQENNQISKEYGGTGLGLSLSRELARLMNGDIKIKSEVGKGSEFVFSVVLDKVEGEFFEDTIDQNFKFKQLNILLVDDNQENRFIVKKYLNDFNITIHEAVDGEDAVNAFGQEKFDLILMDINMPKKDGITATQEMRAMEREQGQIPTFIVALSANALSLEYNKAMAAGCDDYLTKPISRLKLISMIKKWAGEKNSITATEALDLLTSEENDEEIDLEIQALIPMYLESRLKDLVTIQKAYAEKDMVIISKLIHNIKGTALSYGQPELSAVAKKIETAVYENHIAEIEIYIKQMETILRNKNGH